jgi:hypothetical protein
MLTLIIEMTDIVNCCDGMKTMVKDGAIRPTGHQTALVRMQGKNGLEYHDEVKYCQFCGIEIRLM